ncbi:MAG TPA: hypothetical protein VJL61_05875 [Rhodanobacteraceae bacterium]|nr:hypothetical protein [Rhodanobacteraceae bacterium]
MKFDSIVMAIGACRSGGLSIGSHDASAACAVTDHGHVKSVGMIAIT